MPNAMKDLPATTKAPAARAIDAAAIAPRPPVPPRAFPWLGTGIRLFILLLVGGLIIVVAGEWDWWVGSAVKQTTDDAYLQAGKAQIRPVAGGPANGRNAAQTRHSGGPR
jgi:membrane fusion protein (multidrug efflux system)